MTTDDRAGPSNRTWLVARRRRGQTRAGILLLALGAVGCSTTHRVARDGYAQPSNTQESRLAANFTSYEQQILIADAMKESSPHDVRESSNSDKFERLNRKSYQFNRALDRKLLRPVARGYDRIVPLRVERRIRNFFVNLRAPIDIINNLLQGKLAPGFSGVGRFLLNSTAGLGGLFDPAASIGLERHREDFGQTLAVWGIPAGRYLVLPILGSGTLRDWGGFGIDLRSDLIARHNDSNTRNTLLLWRLISNRAALLPAERALDASFDEYVFVRDAYLQHRTYEINDGEILDDDYLFLESDDE